MPYESRDSKESNVISLNLFVSLFRFTRCEGIRSITYFSKYHTHTLGTAHLFYILSQIYSNLDHISYLFNSSLYLFPTILKCLNVVHVYPI